MRNAPFPRLFFITLLTCSSAGWAQTSAPSQAPSQAPTTTTAPAAQQPARALPKPDLSAIPQPATAQLAASQPASSANQLIERIHVEGGTASIDELRVGGETRSITVQPKGGLPAYDVQPTTGTRAWKVLGF